MRQLLHPFLDFLVERATTQEVAARLLWHWYSRTNQRLGSIRRRMQQRAARLIQNTWRVSPYRRAFWRLQEATTLADQPAPDFARLADLL